jgi:peptidoglycan hydrolase-like protein with peptidoglycan-binding domain
MSIPSVGFSILTPDVEACSVSNPTVQGVQRALNELAGKDVLAEDGSFDVRTSDMVRAFQGSHGLVPTGAIDQATVDALNREIVQLQAAVYRSGIPGAAPAGSGASMRSDHALEGALMKTKLAAASTVATASPLGVPYGEQAIAGDNERIFRGGKLNRSEVVNRLTQYDQSGRTGSDADRCGAAAAIASAIMDKGEKGLLNLVAGARGALTETEAAGLNDVEKRIRAGTATFNDLGKLADALQQAYATPDSRSGGRLGILDADLLSLYKEAGMRPPARTGDPHDSFRPGQSWPIALQLADGSDHWIVAGKDARGKVFIYDPLPTPGQPQLHYEGTPGYKAYTDQIFQTRAVYAPINEDQAGEARRAADQ